MAPAPQQPRVEATVSDVRLLSPHVLGIRVQGPEDYHWVSGQHLLVGAASSGDAAGYYSIASAPAPEAPGVFDLAARADSLPWEGETEAGTPLWIGEAQGALPMGRLRGAGRVVLVGMGTGVAPLRAVLQELLSSSACDVRLLQGARTWADLLYSDEFDGLQGGRFSYEPVLSRPDATWDGRRGRVQEHLGPPQAGTEYCVCGSRQMVDNVERLLREQGAASSEIFTEGY